MNFFVSSFKLQINEEVAKFLSFNIEESIYKLHSAERDPKAYLAKAKTLAFNLKKNEVLILQCNLHLYVTGTAFTPQFMNFRDLSTWLQNA